MWTMVIEDVNWVRGIQEYLYYLYFYVILKLFLEKSFKAK